MSTLTGSTSGPTAGRTNRPDHRSNHRTDRAGSARHARQGQRGTLGVLAHQLRYDAKMQSRNLAAMFFTMALPLIFVVLFSVTSDDAATSAEYFVPAMMVLAVASGTLTNIAVTLAYLREYGQLKRILVTPVPRSAYLGSRLIASGVVSIVSVLLLGVVGSLAFDAAPPTAADLGLLALAVVSVLVVGSCLGLAAAALIRSEVAAAPLANAICLPLLLASGVFFPLDSAPDWFADVAAVLPFTPAVEVATAAYEGTVAAQDLVQLGLVTAGWTALAVLVVWRFFRWAPARRR